MVFPNYLLGIGIPIIVGVLSLGYYIFQQQQQQQQHNRNEYQQKHYTPDYGYDTRHDINHTTDVCSICLEDLNYSIQILNCGHKLHQLCFQRLIKRDKKCPECRQTIHL